MISRSDIMAFVGTTNSAESRAFYEGVLGLSLVNDGPQALEFDANGTMLRVVKLESHTPASYTVLGWKVANIHAEIDALIAKGLAFEQYDGTPQDEQGVWVSPAGAKVAWFKDPDGNTLSLTEF